MPVWPVWPVSQNQLKFVQEMVVQVVSCVLLEMTLAFLGILCNLLVVTTIRHQVIFLFWSRILLTMIMIRNQEFAVYGEKTQEELQNSTTNLLLINLCFSNLLVSFLVTKLFFLKWNRDQFRSIWKYLKFIEMEKGISSEILSVGKAKLKKGPSTNRLWLQSKLISWKTFVGLFSHSPIYDWALSFRLAMEPPLVVTFQLIRTRFFCLI